MSDTPLTDAAIERVDVAYVGYDGLSSSPEEYVSPDFARELELRLAQRTAEVEMLRGVGCEADGDGRCGVCVKCLKLDARRYRAIRQWPTIELLQAFDAPADGTLVSPEELDEAVDAEMARKGAP
jgi:hypothetical protein